MQILLFPSTYTGGIYMDMKDIKIDLIRCGYKQIPNTSKWAKAELNTMLPNTQAQYFDYNSKYQYSQVRKLK